MAAAVPEAAEAAEAAVVDRPQQPLGAADPERQGVASRHSATSRRWFREQRMLSRSAQAAQAVQAAQALLRQRPARRARQVRSEPTGAPRPSDLSLPSKALRPVEVVVLVDWRQQALRPSPILVHSVSWPGPVVQAVS